MNTISSFKTALAKQHSQNSPSEVTRHPHISTDWRTAGARMWGFRGVKSKTPAQILWESSLRDICTSSTQTMGTVQRLMEITYRWAWTKSPFCSGAHRVGFFSFCVSPECIILSAPSAQHNLLITTALFSTICRGLTAQDVSFVPQTTWSHIPRKGDLHIINTETKLVTSRETIISPHAVGAHIQEQPLRYLLLKRGDK